MYVYAPSLQPSAPMVFMVWLRACSPPRHAWHLVNKLLKTVWGFSLEPGDTAQQSVSLISLCVRIICIATQTEPQTIVTWRQIGWASRPERTANYSVPTTVTVGGLWIIDCMDGWTHLLEEPIFPFLIVWCFKSGARICLLYFPEFIVSEKKMQGRP
jgi:hypothetical protein